MPDLTEAALAHYEQVAAAQALNLSVSPISWDELVAVAQQAFGRAHIGLRDGDQNADALLRASSRIFDSAARESTALPPDHRERLAALAAVAFSMQGNAPAATAVINRFPTLVTTPSGLSPAIATAAPTFVGRLLRAVPGDSEYREYLETLNLFLDTGDEDLVGRLVELLDDAILNRASPFESLLLLGARHTVARLAELSVQAVVRPNVGPLLQSYVDRLVSDGIRTLLPPQVEALNEVGLLGESNAVVALPTSAGKTLLGELALVASLERGPGLACYVAPYVALGRQVVQILRRRLPSNIPVHPMIGGYRLPQPMSPHLQPEIAVCTPERFDALLRSDPSISESLRCVVFDEAHLVGNGERGLRLEGLVTRLRLLQDQGRAFRIVMLSAVVSNADELVDWLDRARTVMVSSTWRPTARRTMFWGNDGQLLMLLGDDPVRRPDQSAGTVLARQSLPWPEPSFYSTSNIGQQLAQLPKAYRNVAFLARFVLPRDEGSVLCICASREGTRTLAREVAEQLSPLEPLPPTIARAITQIRTRRRYLRTLEFALERGVAYHNAALPTEIRELVEAAARSGELAIVVATTTLAEGVDLPFRFTVLADWLVASSSGQRPMDPLLFRNIAGRSGRAGAHTEGVTLVYDNVVGDPALTAPQYRRNLQRQVFASDALPPLRSMAVDESFSNDERLRATAASNLLAAVAENPGENNLTEVLERRSFAFAVGGSSRLRTALDQARQEILDDSGGALAVAASPLRLTPFGTAANLTGLAPPTCRRIVEVLPAIAERWNDPSGVVATLLHRLATVPEQTNARLSARLAGSNNRYPVGPADIEMVFSAWMAGVAEEDIFGQLALVRNSKRQPPAAAWLQGSADSPTWPVVFDRFIDFLQVTVMGFLPWVLRGCETLRPFAEGMQAAVDWALLGDLLETGTDNRWSAAAVREGAPGSRRGAIVVGHHMDDLATPDDPLAISFVRVDTSSVLDRFNISLADTGTDADLREEVSRIQSWLFERA